MAKEILLSFVTITTNLFILPFIGGWILSRTPAMKHLFFNC